jgi:hypothetical protein
MTRSFYAEIVLHVAGVIGDDDVASTEGQKREVRYDSVLVNTLAHAMSLAALEIAIGKNR